MRMPKLAISNTTGTLMNEYGNIEELYKHYLASNGVTTDSRKIEAGNIYFALKGERFDGNAFAQNAISLGASLAVVDDPMFKGKSNYFLVEDVLTTLQELSSYVRDKWDFPVIAITGSNGKTTTKELLAAVLNRGFKVFSTPGNFNNHIGLPLTLLMTPPETNMLILELGSNHLGEHAFLCELAKPDYGIVTNNGKDHLEGYGSVENVIKSNSELYDYLRKTGGHAFVNADDHILMKESDGLKRHTYSFTSESENNASIQQEELFAAIKTQDGSIIASKLVGSFNAINILAAVTIGKYFGITEAEIKSGIASYDPGLNRSQFIQYRNMDVILDAYNANPSSMELSLSTMKNVKKSKMVILGGMRELGDFEYEEHQKVLDILAGMDLDHIWLIGKEFFQFRNIENVKWFENTEDCRREFGLFNQAGICILVKGSRSYQLEKLFS